jgi:hypothetical protein
VFSVQEVGRDLLCAPQVLCHQDKESTEPVRGKMKPHKASREFPVSVLPALGWRRRHLGDFAREHWAILLIVWRQREQTRVFTENRRERLRAFTALYALDFTRSHRMAPTRTDESVWQS